MEVFNDENESKKRNIKGTVVLMKKNVLDFNDFHATFLDQNRLQGKVGEPAYLEDWITTITSLTAGESAFKVTFDWDNEIEVPGAILIKNKHHSEFYLKSITLEDVPGEGQIHFVCNSWVYPADKYKKGRILFFNKYREEELVNLRGDGKGELQEWDRVYDYAYYNDLGSPKHVHPILGGSSEYPYPRRGRTGRPPTEADPKIETRLNPLLSINIYVLRDERFGHLKMSNFVAFALKAIAQFLKPELETAFSSTPNEFDKLQDILNLYEGGIELPNDLLQNIRKNIPGETLKEIFRTDGEGVLKFPVAQVIKEDKSAWRTDEEFAREMLAGVNPVIIHCLQEFPPSSKLDSKVYGDQTRTIIEEHIGKYLNGLSIDEAIKSNKLFILDHHDALMPYLKRINETSTKIYTSRTLLFLKEDGTLKPLAIKLSLPHPDGNQVGAISKVYTPTEEGFQSCIWQLAKAYVAVIDSGYHQLISHWLHTHAAIEPFVIATIATNRQLSVLQPIYKLLHPHFRDTMNVNALARQVLINAGVDYPYVVDGLEIWSAIKTWVKDYCSFYYKTDDMVQNDFELQSWWKELREEGHGDKKDEPWWPKMQTHEELIETCTITIWIASALHAAINFGQYPYGGYPPNRPAMSRQFMPEEGNTDNKELKTHPDKAFLKTFSSQLESVLGISLVEILSRHSSDEIYLGQRDSLDWTSDKTPLAAFERFGKKLEEIEDRITKRNKDEKLKNCVGPIKMPYTLLYPTSEEGLTAKGIPNSVSI
ncbi:probable linoleate 9S-lipoxygenase 5 [Fagus crenata]